MRRSCCPHYTIRLPVAVFRAKKSQRSACHRWNRFVLGEDYVKKAALLRPISKADKAHQRNGFDLAVAIHEAEFDRLPSEPVPAHRFSVTLEPASFTEEKYQVYSNYQQHVHGDKPSDCTREGFRRFLCDTPLVQKPSVARDGPETLPLYGSYHQCYWLDGRLIAVGVLDLLPHCVSGVYFLYHSDYEAFSFGKLSALREACLALEGEYQYYYMGYYIHSCSKMRYKNDYQPQYFLDLETMNWDPLDEHARKLLDRTHYLSMSSSRRQDETSSKDSANRPSEPLLPDGVGATAVRQLEKLYSEEKVSLFQLEMAGMMTEKELQETIDLGHIRIKLRGGHTYRCRNLAVWDTSTIRDHVSIKRPIAELVACVGPDMAEVMVLDYS